MEFDKSKVYTAVNADEVKAGSRGYFYDDLDSLKQAVNNEYELCTVNRIRGTDQTERFEDNEKYEGSTLFYLVEEPKEKKFRPYKDTDEMIEDFNKRYNSYGGWNGRDNPMYCPLIWVKDCAGIKSLVTTFRGDSVTINGPYYDMKDLLDYFTYLDGTPAGAEI